MSWTINKTNCISNGECPEIADIEFEIRLTRKAINQIKTLLGNFPETEWLAGINGECKGDVYHIKELKIIEQNVTSGTALATRNGNKDVAANGFIGLIHSHNSMEAILSQFDDEIAEMYIVTIVVNNNFEFGALVKRKLPCGREALFPANVIAGDYTIDKDILEQADKLITKTTIQTEVGEVQQIHGTIICETCNQVVGKHNKDFCEKCQATLHIKCKERNKGLCETCSRYEDEEYDYVWQKPGWIAGNLNNPNLKEIES